MDLVIFVIMLALLQYFFFGVLVGRARGKYNVPAPATTGNEIFERYNRVHINTQESLMLFLPGMVMFGGYTNANIAVGLGIIYLIGRFIYLTSYIKDPKTRSLGYGLTALPSLILVIGGGISALMAAI